MDKISKAYQRLMASMDGRFYHFGSASNEQDACVNLLQSEDVFREQIKKRAPRLDYLLHDEG